MPGGLQEHNVIQYEYGVVQHLKIKNRKKLDNKLQSIIAFVYMYTVSLLPRTGHTMLYEASTCSIVGI